MCLHFDQHFAVEDWYAVFTDLFLRWDKTNSERDIQFAKGAATNANAAR